MKNSFIGIILLLISFFSYAGDDLKTWRYVYQNPPSPIIIFQDYAMNSWLESNHGSYLRGLLEDKSIKIKNYDSYSFECSFSQPAFSIDGHIGLCLNNFNVYMQMMGISNIMLWLSMNYGAAQADAFETYALAYYLAANKKYAYQRSRDERNITQICSVWVLAYGFTKKKPANDCLAFGASREFSDWYKAKVASNPLDELKNIATYIKLSTEMDRNILSFLILHEYAHIKYNHNQNINFTQQEEEQADEYALKKLAETDDMQSALFIVMSFYFSSMYVTDIEDAPPVFHRFNQKKSNFVNLYKEIFKELDDAGVGDAEVRRAYKEKINDLFDKLPDNK